MGLLKRRYLCIFSVIFILCSVISYFTSFYLTIVLFSLFLVFFILFVILSLVIKKHHVKLVTASICLFVIFFSFLYSFLTVSLQRKTIKESEGQGIAHCKIISELDTYGDVREYCVKIIRIGDKPVSMRGTLSIASDVSASPFDEIYGAAIIEEETDSSALSDGRLVYLYMGESDKAYIRYTSKEQNYFALLFTDIGIEILSDTISDNLSRILNINLGEDIGPLASGFFTGNKAGVSSIVKRDFRRSGTSHLMAVSGLHMSVLLGSVELLLRRLRMNKTLRCVTVTFIGVAFLFAAGFAPSACRSFLMLFILYVSFFIYEENDGITSLFVSVVIILLIFPYSVIDIGLWLSVFATLGLLTVYPVLEEKIPYPRLQNKVWNALLIFIREIGLIALTSFVSNMFVLPLLWIFFGEFSVVSVFANIILSYVSTAFMVAIPIYLVLFKIPLVGAVATFVVRFLGKIILNVVAFCSRLDFAVVSLRYAFCTVILVIFTVSMLVLLIVDLKRKYLVALPMVFVVVSFLICFTLTDIFLSKPLLTYVNDGNSEIISVNDGSEISFCDNSTGMLSLVYRVREEMNERCATQIENYLLLHYHDGHVAYIDKLTSENVVKRLLLPKPHSDEDVWIFSSILEVAKRNGVAVEIYEKGGVFGIVDGVGLCVTSPRNDESGVEMLFVTEDEKVIYTTSGRYAPRENYSLAIIGLHGAIGERSFLGLNADKILLGSSDVDRDVYKDGAKLYRPSNYKYFYKANYSLA